LKGGAGAKIGAFPSEKAPWDAPADDSLKALWVIFLLVGPGDCR